MDRSSIGLLIILWLTLTNHQNVNSTRLFTSKTNVKLFEPMKKLLDNINDDTERTVTAF